jgi:hypothetical protein
MALNSFDLDQDVFGVLFKVRTDGLESVKGVIKALDDTTKVSEEAKGSLVNVGQVLEHLGKQGMSTQQSLAWIAKGGDQFMSFSREAQSAAKDTLRVGDQYRQLADTVKNLREQQRQLHEVADSGTGIDKTTGRVLHNNEELLERTKKQILVSMMQMEKLRDTSAATERTTHSNTVAYVARELGAKPVIYDLNKGKSVGIADEVKASAVQNLLPVQRVLLEQAASFMERRQQQYMPILDTGGRPYNQYVGGSTNTVTDSYGRPKADSYGDTSGKAKGNSASSGESRDQVTSYERMLAAAQHAMNLRNAAIEIVSKGITGDVAEATRIVNQLEALSKRRGTNVISGEMFDEVSIKATANENRARETLNRLQTHLDKPTTLESVAAGMRPDILRQRSFALAQHDINAKIAEEYNKEITQEYLAGVARAGTGVSKLNANQLNELQGRRITAEQVAKPVPGDEEVINRLERATNRVANRNLGGGPDTPEMAQLRKRFQETIEPIHKRLRDVSDLIEQTPAGTKSYGQYSEERNDLQARAIALSRQHDSEMLKLKLGPEQFQRLQDKVGLDKAMETAVELIKHQSFAYGSLEKYGGQNYQQAKFGIYSNTEMNSRQRLAALNELDLEVAKMLEDPVKGDIKQANKLRREVADRQKALIELDSQERQKQYEDERQERLSRYKKVREGASLGAGPSQSSVDIAQKILRGEMSIADLPKLYKGSASIEDQKPPKQDPAIELVRQRLASANAKAMATIGTRVVPESPNQFTDSSIQREKMALAEERTVGKLSDLRRKNNQDQQNGLKQLEEIHDRVMKRVSNAEQNLSDKRTSLEAKRQSESLKVAKAIDEANSKLGAAEKKTIFTDASLSKTIANLDQGIKKRETQLTEAKPSERPQIESDIRRFQTLRDLYSAKRDELPSELDSKAAKIEADRAAKISKANETIKKSQQDLTDAEKRLDEVREAAKNRLQRVDDLFVARHSENRRKELLAEKQALENINLARRQYEETTASRIERNIGRRGESLTDIVNSRSPGYAARFAAEAANQFAISGRGSVARIQQGYGPPDRNDPLETFPDQPRSDYNAAYERYTARIRAIQKAQDDGWSKIKKKEESNARELTARQADVERMPEGPEKNVASTLLGAERTRRVEELSQLRDAQERRDAEGREKARIAEEKYTVDFEKDQQRRVKALTSEMTARKESVKLILDRNFNPAAFNQAREEQARIFYSSQQRVQPAPLQSSLQIDQQLNDGSNAWMSYERTATGVLSRVERARQKFAEAQGAFQDRMAFNSRIVENAPVAERGAAQGILTATRIQGEEELAKKQATYRDAELKGKAALAQASRQYAASLEREKKAATDAGDAAKQNNLLNLAAQLTIIEQVIKRTVVQMIEYASRTETMKVVTEQLARANGISSVALNQEVEIIKHLNVTTQAAHETVQRMMFAQLDARQAPALARVAQDTAVITGRNSSETLENLITGIVTGQTRILHMMGLQVSQLSVNRQLREDLGREPTDFEKRQAMLNAVLKEGAKITGAYEAAMLTANKQMTSLQRQFQEAENAIGKQFQPALMNLIGFMGDFASSLRTNAQEWAMLIRLVGGATVAFAAFKGIEFLSSSGKKFLTELFSISSYLQNANLTRGQGRFAPSNLRAGAILQTVASIGLGVATSYFSGGDSVSGAITSANTVRNQNLREIQDLTLKRESNQIDDKTYRESIARFVRQNSALEKQILNSLTQDWIEKASKIQEIWLENDPRRQGETTMHGFQRWGRVALSRLWDVVTGNRDSYQDSGYSFMEAIGKDRNPNFQEEYQKRLGKLKDRIRQEGTIITPDGKPITADVRIADLDKKMAEIRKATTDPLYNVRGAVISEAEGVQGKIQQKIDKAKDQLEDLRDRLIEKTITDPVELARHNAQRELKKHSFEEELGPLRELVKTLGINPKDLETYTKLQAGLKATGVRDKDVDLYDQILGNVGTDRSRGQTTQAEADAELAKRGLTGKGFAIKKFKEITEVINTMAGDKATAGIDAAFEAQELEKKSKKFFDELKGALDRVTEFTIAEERNKLEKSKNDFKIATLSLNAGPGLSEERRVVSETRQLAVEQLTKQYGGQNQDKAEPNYNVTADSYKLAEGTQQALQSEALSLLQINQKERNSALQFEVQKVEGRYQLEQRLMSAKMQSTEQQTELNNRMYDMEIQKSAEIAALDKDYAAQRQRNLQAEIQKNSTLIDIKKQQVESDRGAVQEQLQRRFQQTEKLLRASAMTPADEMVTDRRAYELRLKLADDIYDYSLKKKEDEKRKELEIEDAKFDYLERRMALYKQKLTEARDSAGHVFDALTSSNRGSEFRNLYQGILKTSGRTIFQNAFGEIFQELRGKMQLPFQATGIGTDHEKPTFLGHLLSGTIFGREDDPRKDIAKQVQTELTYSTSSNTQSQDRLTMAIDRLNASTLALAQLQLQAAQGSPNLAGTAADELANLVNLPGQAASMGSTAPNPLISNPLSGLAGLASQGAEFVKQFGSGVTPDIGGMATAALRAFGVAPQVKGLPKLSDFLPGVSSPSTDQIKNVITTAASNAGVDPAIMLGLADSESSFRPGVPNAQGSGATGLFQFIKSTAKQYGVTDRTDPVQSAFGAANYVKDLLQKTGGNVEQAISIYKGVSAGGATPEDVQKTLGMISKYGGAQPAQSVAQAAAPLESPAFSTTTYQPNVEAVEPFQYRGSPNLGYSVKAAQSISRVSVVPDFLKPSEFNWVDSSGLVHTSPVPAKPNVKQMTDFAESRYVEPISMSMKPKVGEFGGPEDHTLMVNGEATTGYQATHQAEDLAAGRAIDPNYSTPFTKSGSFMRSTGRPNPEGGRGGRRSASMRFDDFSHGNKLGGVQDLLGIASMIPVIGPFAQAASAALAIGRMIFGPSRDEAEEAPRRAAHQQQVHRPRRHPEDHRRSRQ